MNDSGADNQLTLATHYEVLGLTPTILDSQHDPAILIKRAYHRALLRNHPDKAKAQQPPQSSTVQKRAIEEPDEEISHIYNYTIDQITRAFNTLSSSRQRREYDVALRISRPVENSRSQRQAQFQTGVESIDLDDIAFDEERDRWYRPCRCGNDYGYCFQGDDLIEAETEGELMVGCQDCSLWLRVHFAVIEENASIM